VLLEAVCSAGGFVRGAKAQEIKRHHTPPTGCQVRDQIVPDAQVIREAVHEHKGRTSAFVIARVNSSFLSRNVVLDERRGAVDAIIGFGLS
jgi:hypothetical protein